MTQTFDDSTAPWAGGPYSVKRHGVSISNCDSEPVQTPGCIQAHGALMVLRLSDLTILQASENTLYHLDIRDVALTIMFSDGTARDLFGDAVPLFDESSNVRGAVGAFVDTTQHNRARSRP
jgi:hypothetical protein